MAESHPDQIPIHLPSGRSLIPLPAKGAAQPSSVAAWLKDNGVALNTRCGCRGLCHGCELEWDGRLTRSCQLAVPPDTNHSIRVPARNILSGCERETTDFILHLPTGRAPAFEWTEDRPYGVVVDIGTTTIDLMIVDLRDGAIQARVGGYNQQICYGDNVLSRIEYASRKPENVTELQEALVKRSLAPLLQQALAAIEKKSGAAGIVLSGNPTLCHLLLGIDPTPLGLAPFTPVFLESRRGTVSEWGWPRLPGATPWLLLPGIAAYVGSDLTAGLFASGMVYRQDTCILLDIGTNGEIILQHGGKRVACATAAGPAFEGGGLRCGARASADALSHLSWDAAAGKFYGETPSQVATDCISGICGTAYLDFLAEGRRAGWLTDRGRFAGDWWQAVASLHQAPDEWGRAYRIVADNDHSIISEADVALLLQAKAAIAGGLLTLLDQFSLQPGDVDRLFLAGTFGRHVRASSLIGMGLLPGFNPSQVEVVGNGSLGGAYLALLDRSLVQEMEDVRTSTQVLELNETEEFEDHYIDQLVLPC